MRKTKAEEREALAKIREILSGLGDDSYVGKAFECCVEQADENIRHEWMHSWKERYDITFRNLNAREADLAELTRQLNQKDDAIARLTDAKNQLSEEIGRMDGVIAQRDSSRQELLGRLADAKETADDLRQTIIELKAKLYDMMTREEVKG